MARFRVVAGGFSCGPKTAAEKDPAPGSPLPPVVLDHAGDGATLAAGVTVAVRTMGAALTAREVVHPAKPKWKAMAAEHTSFERP